MKIKKIGHCCLVIDIDGVRVLTDPGGFTQEENGKITGVDIVLITHEHGDHLHAESLHKIIENNPDAVIITNSAVGKILDEEGIAHQVLEGRDTKELNTILIEAFDAKHAEIFDEYGQVQNTGYFIGNKLFYPGDAYCNPGKAVDVLAMPAGGPWCRVADTIRYAIEVAPRITFPVHDAIEREDRVNIPHRVIKDNLQANNLEFIPMLSGDEKEF